MNVHSMDGSHSQAQLLKQVHRQYATDSFYCRQTMGSSEVAQMNAAGTSRDFVLTLPAAQAPRCCKNDINCTQQPEYQVEYTVYLNCSSYTVN